MKITAILLPLALGACSGLGYIVETYGSVDAVTFQSQGMAWRIYDLPAANKVMVTPSVGRSAGQGLVLGAANNAEQQFERAAIEWLAKTGRNCEVGNGFILVNPQYEFPYTCS